MDPQWHYVAMMLSRVVVGRGRVQAILGAFPQAPEELAIAA